MVVVSNLVQQNYDKGRDYKNRKWVFSGRVRS